MNKKNKPILLLAALLAVMLCAYFLLSAAAKNSAAAQLAQQQADAAVTSLTGVTHIAATTGGASLSFDKLDGVWQCAQYDGWPVAQNTAASYAAAFETLSASRILTEHGALSEYALDAPQYVFVASNDAGDTQTLSLSEHDNGRWYAMLDGDARVFIVDDALSAFAGRDILSWVDYETLPAWGEDDMTAVTLERGGSVYSYMRSALEAAHGSESAEPAYNWTAQKDGAAFEPVAANVETATYDIAQLTQLGCSAYAPSETELAALGFDGSETVLRVCFLDGDAETTAVLRFGAPVTVDGTLCYYLTLNGGEAVTTVAAAGVDDLVSLLISTASNEASGGEAAE